MSAGYKQTEIGMIPQEWCTLELQELTDRSFPICYGIVQVGPSTPNGVPVLAIKNLNLDYSTNIHCASAAIERPYARSRIQPRDVLVSVKGTTGRVGIAPSFFRGNISRDIARIRPAAGIAPHFIYHSLQSDIAQHRLTNATVGTTRLELSIAVLKQVRIPLPPTRAEQEAIAEALSDADAFIESLEQLLAKKRDLKQGAMQELLSAKRRLPGFGGRWEATRLGCLGSTFGGLSGKTKKDFCRGLSKYITFINVLMNVVIDTHGFGLVDVKPGESQNRVAKNDLFFNGSSETPNELGLCALLTHDVEELFLNSFCFGFRPHQGALADGLYLAYFFRSGEGRELLKSLAQGAIRYNLSKTALLKLELKLPGLAEQTAIAAVLSDMDAELAALEAKLAKARQIKQGMMQELLTGRIRLV